MHDKKQLSERDICTKFITPAIKNAGWDIHSQIREEVTLTAGRIIVRGQAALRAKGARADYVLYYKPGIPLAVVEAKGNNHGVGAGLQQALGYADLLNVPFALSSNGDGFMFHDRSGGTLVERELTLGAFPSPQYLWERFKAWKGYSEQALPVVTQDYCDDGSGKAPRYYQIRAINAALEAIARGQERVLLVMATGTGKTYTAFQIIWRLWKAGARRRILFLADRNILVDQTKTNDFKPFGTAMTKITGRNVDPSYEVYLSLYQAITGPHEEQKAFKQFSSEFFDLIVIDECHRGSAAADSAWREILEYFSAATHLGLTATPKETKEVSNITYFGEPVYTYSLKQGIQDGFLAPYKVVRVDLDRDLQGWRPTLGQRDKYGYVIEDRIYNQRDFDRKLVIDERTQLVAKIVSDHLEATERMAKTIVFCQDIDHAERMRQALVNENADLVARNRKYVMRITGDEAAGKAELDNFIDPEQPYPTLVTTSELLTTGVDSKTCKLIVLDQRIESMTKFKQMIGRGTRIEEDYGKLWFTIIDFRKATELFADPDFDGEPVVIFTPQPGGATVPGEEGNNGAGDRTEGSDDTDGEADTAPHKYHVSGVTVRKLAERTQYFGKDGKLITESIKDYTRATVRAEYRSLDEFLRKWDEAEQKAAIIQELSEQGVIWEALEEEIGKDYGAFDLICHVVFDQPPLTRRERAEQVRKQDYFTRYGDQARRVLEALLEKYAASDVANIESIDVLRVQPLNELGTPVELVRAFGGKKRYQQAVQALERALYVRPASTEV